MGKSVSSYKLSRYCLLWTLFLVLEFNDENIDPIDPGNRKDLKSHNNDDAVAQANKKGKFYICFRLCNVCVEVRLITNYDRKFMLCENVWSHCGSILPAAVHFSAFVAKTFWLFTFIWGFSNTVIYYHLPLAGLTTKRLTDYTCDIVWNAGSLCSHVFLYT